MTNEELFADFLKSVHRPAMRDTVLVGYAWVECPVALLEELIPEAAQIIVFGESHEYDPTMTLRDLSMEVVISLDETMALVRIAAKDLPTGRMDYVNADHLAIWLGYLTPYGFTLDTWLDLDGRNERLASSDYTAGE